MVELQHYIKILQHGESEESPGDTSNEPLFPVDILAKLDGMINKQSRWVVPVLPDGELEVLLNAAIKLSETGLDKQSRACQNFYKYGLVLSFTKILTEDAVSCWKYNIQRGIMENCRLLIDLCVNKLNEDNIVLIDLLSTVLCPTSKFQLYNASKSPDMLNMEEQDIYARPRENRIPARGWLIELINRFGKRGGFVILRDRFTVAPGEGRPLTFPLISSLIRPFDQCYDMLTPATIKTYFMPIVDIVTQFLRGLSDEDMKKNSKDDALSVIMKSLKCLVAHVPNQGEKIRELEIFRLEMILRLFKVSSFNGKMYALNEMNEVIMNVSYYYNRSCYLSLDEEEWLTAKMAAWISENNVLSIVLRDSLHQPQYVEELENIVRLLINEKNLTAEDLDTIWQAQHGKHGTIVKNIHELLAELAWDFSPEQLDHLFKCFQDSWHNANQNQREKLLELIMRLAEEDTEGVRTQKVLGLLWTLARDDECPTDMMDQALSALIKILDYSCSQTAIDSDKLKLEWTYKFLGELKNNKLWVLPTLMQIMEICKLFNEAPATFGHQGQSTGRVTHILFRDNVINEIQKTHKLVMTVSQNLVQYMDNAAEHRKDQSHPDVLPEDYLPDFRYNHLQQVTDRLKFLRFVLKDGHLWLLYTQAVQIWECLAINAVYPSDREACFKWFTELMGWDPDLDPDITKEFFENQILKLDPSLLTENGMSCFERFFRIVNIKEGSKLIEKKHCLVMNDLNLVGMDYLWTVILHSSDKVAKKAIALMKELHANLGPNLQTKKETIHNGFIWECFERLNTSYDTLQCLTKDCADEREREANRMVRVLTVLHEYINECNGIYSEERALLSLARTSRGKNTSLFIRMPGRQGSRPEDMEIWSHSIDTLGCVKRQFFNKLDLSNQKLAEIEEQQKAAIDQFKVDLAKQREDNSKQVEQQTKELRDAKQKTELPRAMIDKQKVANDNLREKCKQQGQELRDTKQRMVRVEDKQREDNAKPSERCEQQGQDQGIIVDHKLEASNKEQKATIDQLRAELDRQREGNAELAERAERYEMETIQQAQELRSLIDRQERMENMMEEMGRLLRQPICIGPEMDQEYEGH